MSADDEAMQFSAVRVLSAAVPFYGLPRFPTDDFANVKATICGHYAEVDDWVDRV